MSEANGQPEKRPVGRPRTLTPDKLDEIIRCIETGLSRTVAAKYVGVHVSTIHKEARRNDEFGDRLDNAEAKFEAFHLKKVSSSDDWRASAWILGRKFKDRWAETTRLQIEEVDEDELDRDIEQRLEVLAQREKATLPGSARSEADGNGNGAER